MLRRTDNSELQNHFFLNAEHAKDWLMKDKANNERFTVCFVMTEEHGPELMCGALRKHINTVQREITCDQFIEEVMNGEHG